jgi:hypothetical protein
MAYRGAVVCLTLATACSGTVGSGRDSGLDVPGDGGLGGDVATDASDAGDAGPPTVEGRVLVVQSGGASSPEVWTRAWFAWASPCRTFWPTLYSCSCTDSEAAGCTTRTCSARWPGASWYAFLGYDPGDGLQTSAAGPITTQLLNAGAMQTHNGSSVFTHASPYDAHDPLSAPWQPGDVIGISADGADAPPFSVEVPFPPSVTFLQPDLSTGKITFDSNTLDVKWTAAAQGAGSVEATIAMVSQPDSILNLTVTRCSAPVAQGEVVVPVPPLGVGNAWRGLAVRVLNRTTLEVAGLTLDALVASYDSGPLDEANASF